ncbi:dimethylaniline monooxygenase [n-oxide-forming] [Plakobranchus ocellatus]|uniref:Flavin-containing monooxygenase n=1 Tax=Plakobranchus ocellatus TaxID=259542 RepID=A0AAV4BG89_9GAST|nr:dimethylaniline monooxygenase [n-oxide-forming] [Plakobranchus ocellatus]
MAPKCRRVAVLGAGVAGLAAIKTCLEEGMEVVAFESRPCVGGLWSGQKDEWSSTGPSMYRSLLSNTSKSMTSFSDFPCPASYPPFLPHNVFRDYLCLYAKHFQLGKYIQLNTRVLKVMRSEDHASSGKWRLTLSTRLQPEGGEGDSSGRDKVWEEEFDGVIVASGFYSKAKSPDYPGLHTAFPGSVSHSCHYVEGSPYQDKTVLVVGQANSAFDIAVDLSNWAKQVYLSVGDGVCVQSRVDASSGLPFDLSLIRALYYWLSSVQIFRLIGWLANRRCNHRTLGLEYTGNLSWPIVVNDEIQQRILAGKVKILRHLSEFTDSGVITADGRLIEGIDHVIFATGYDRDFSVLDESLNLNGEKLELYKQVFPVHEKHHTLALLGCVRVAGPMPPAIELMARMAAYTLSGRHKLPAADVMKADSDRYNKIALKADGKYRYAFVNLMIYEEIASEIGVAPSFWRLLFSGKPKLAFKIFFGPALPYIYRLVGPGAWQGAEAAMDKAIEENLLPLQNRTLVQKPQEGKSCQAFNMLRFFIMLSFIGFAAFWLCGLFLTHV